MIIVTAPAHNYLMERLKEKGHEVSYVPAISYEELSQVIESAVGIFVTTRIRIDKPLLDRAKNLKWIGRLGSGLELIDTAYAEEKNIVCVSSPEGNRNAVAEHALGMLLCLLNNIAKAANEVNDFKWLREENRGRELSGKTVGIIGYGNTGQAFEKLLQSFGVTVLAYDKYKENFGNKEVREVNLEHLQRYADVISFHVPLTEETNYMADENFFSGLINAPVILNTSRGKVIKTSALIEALNQNMISGAALDVLENENLAQLSDAEREEFKILTAHDRVLLTPHIAGYSKEAFLNMSKVILEKLAI